MCSCIVLLKVGVHPFIFGCFFKAGLSNMFHAPEVQYIICAERMQTVLPAFAVDFTLTFWSFDET
jgi:hypothetical protein